MTQVKGEKRKLSEYVQNNDRLGLIISCVFFTWALIENFVALFAVNAAGIGWFYTIAHYSCLGVCSLFLLGYTAFNIAKFRKTKKWDLLNTVLLMLFILSVGMMILQFDIGKFILYTTGYQYSSFTQVGFFWYTIGTFSRGANELSALLFRDVIVNVNFIVGFITTILLLIRAILMRKQNLRAQ